MRGKSPTAGLGPRICIHPECGREFQPYRANQYTCSRRCYQRLESTRQRENDRRKNQEYKDHKNEWRRTDPHQKERMRAYNLESRLARYGATLEEYAAKLAAQHGVCMLCGKPPKPDGTRAAHSLHQDHDHETGRVRDLLCGNCNSGLGSFQDDPLLLRAAADYIERHRRVEYP